MDRLIYQGIIRSKKSTVHGGNGTSPIEKGETMYKFKYSDIELHIPAETNYKKLPKRVKSMIKTNK